MDYPSGLIEISPSVYALIQPDGVTNSGFIVGKNGVVVIDSLMTATLARTLQQEIRRITNTPVTAVINTHFHGDHSFGNQFFEPTTIISHVTCRNELIGKFQSDRLAMMRLFPDAAMELKQIEMTLPDITYEEKLTLHLDNRPIELLYLGPAHTYGDTLVYLPQDKVLFAGDVALHKAVPFPLDGHISSWINVLRKADQLDISAVVPGHGPIGTKADMKEMWAFLQRMRREARRRYESGMSEEDAAREITMYRFSSWMGQERIPMSLHRLYQEFRGELGTAY